MKFTYIIGFPVYTDHVQDPILEGNLVRRVDYADFMVRSVEMDELIGKAPVVSGCNTVGARRARGEEI